MSETVGKLLLQYAGENAKETANFILMVDKFFDCTNVRHRNESSQKLKPFCTPYTTVNDERFEV